MGTPDSQRGWANTSARLWWSTWPILATAGLTFAVWVTQSISSIDRRVIVLEQIGPKDDERMRLQIMAEIQARQAESDARTTAKFAEIVSKLEALQRSLLEFKIRSEIAAGATIKP